MSEVNVSCALAQHLAAAVSDPGRVNDLHELLGEFCHVFRNRLHCLNLTHYLARREEGLSDCDWSRVERAYTRVECFMEQLHWLSRPARLAPIRSTLGMFVDERLPIWADCLARGGRELLYRDDGDSTLGQFDPCRLAKSLDALASWRAEVGAPGTTVLLRRGIDRGCFTLSWEEPAAELPDFGAGCDPSLALPMLARAMTDHHGAVLVSGRGGFKVVLRWPVDGQALRVTLEEEAPKRSPLTARLQHV